MYFRPALLICVLLSSACAPLDAFWQKMQPRHATAVVSTPAHVQTPSLITAADLRTFAPHLSPDYQMALNRPDLLAKYQITTTRRLSHFMAQIALESAGFTRLDENLNYSAKGLRTTFRARVSATRAVELARHPQAIANWVYGGRLGNRGQDTNDGWDYRGSGFIQLTGRGNFLTYGPLVGVDIAAKPDAARSPDTGLLTSLAFWDAHGLNRLADRGDLCGIRRRINGGLNGVDEAHQWYQRAVAAFDTDPATLPKPDGIDSDTDVIELLDILAERGFVATTADPPRQQLAQVLRRYQSARDIPVTGQFDLATLRAISAQHERDLRPDACAR